MQKNSDDSTLICQELLKRITEFELENAKLRVINEKLNARVKMLTQANQELDKKQSEVD